jgi:fructose-1,6-bisphosphatase/inositol monophosphatase family enzyme
VTDVDVDRVAALLDEVARAELEPRFQRLAAEDIHDKATPDNPGDVVTEADLAAERALRAGLMAIAPGARFLGEEAAAADPTLLGLLDGDDPVWVVDPLDGTRNFAAGVPAFGIIVAFVARGVTRAGWIHLPREGVTLTAVAGGGAFEAKRRLHAPAALARGDKPRGSIYTRFMTADDRERFERPNPAIEPLPAYGVSALEYAALARGAKDFVLYHRLLPWDHAAGALIVSEAGGAVRHPDGRAYRAAGREARALAVADAAAWDAARAAIGLP